MTKSELVDRLAKKGEIARPMAEKALNAFIASVEDALCQDGKLSIAGLGTFVVDDRQCRTGVNPKTREPMTIPACKVVKFRPAKALKEAVDQVKKA